MEQDKKHHVKTISTGLSPAAQQRLQRFKTEYKQSLRDDIEAIALAVVVWGPGVDVESPAAQKRWDIKEALAEKGHAPVFSEELDDEEDLQDLIETGEGLLLKALHQAKNADFLILLLDDRAMGVITELSICTRRDIAAKTFVMVPESFQKDFTYTAAITMIQGGNGAIQFYTYTDLERCYVLTAAVKRVEARRRLFAWQRSGAIV
ncbi:hypothetical protein [Dictyobacter arantiisoli]|uniref:Uncharacterized protein n=1 Tax=Dictyobacter arantiisoli TaxID=2014874 RepID=A0A5A5THC5_9CHLR|nr:hypothetical protein [Dictyobacter arantiisoli]GCF10546.1 hypothetical protein KDI_41100 [Dictyobacter arantiisoli]